MTAIHVPHKMFHGGGGLVIAVAALLATAGIAFAAGRSTAPNPAAPASPAQATTSAHVSAMMPWVQTHSGDITWMRGHMGDVTWSQTPPSQWQWFQAHPAQWQWFQSHPAQVASGIRCKSTGAVPDSMIRLCGGPDSFGLIIVLGRGDGGWPQLAGWFEQ
jgi:hypothetical protein